MTKVLTDLELLQIISRTITGDFVMIDEQDTYMSFIEELASLIASYGGAELVSMSDAGEETSRTTPFDEDRICAHFAANECTPSDGGVFKEYDNDEDIAEWLGEYA